MEKKEMLYEGKAKRVYATGVADEVIIEYKDDATAFNGEKKGTIRNKGIMNNQITSFLFELLGRADIPTHFIKKLSDREQLCKKVEIVPLEVIVRNIAAGSFTKRYGVAEGTKLNNSIIELCYKDDALGDPFINDSGALALGFVTEEDLAEIHSLTKRINQILVDFFVESGVILVDFKLEFGRSHGQIVLADEISPDTCRFWDAQTGEKLDKDRFRQDLGTVEEAYQKMMDRINQTVGK